MKQDFESIYVCPDYGLNTLINGNLSECVRYFNELITSDFENSTKHIQSRVGICIAIDEMNKIKEWNESKYTYILNKIGIYRTSLKTIN